MKSTVSSVHPYVCTECGSEVRMAAEIVPDDWDSYKNQGYRFACECTSLEADTVDRPQHWVLDTDHEVGSA